MPEGDTIHKLAAAVAPRLEGRTLVRGRLAAWPHVDLAGARVERVGARGKHLFVDLDDGRRLRSHLGMRGTWHRYAPGEPWRRSERAAGIVLATDDAVFVCFRPQQVELLDAGSLRDRDLARDLGPDLLAADCDLDAVLARVAARVPDGAPAVDLLLDQRVACGIGNVYKCEVLFLERVHPLAPVGTLAAGSRRRLFQRARELLLANLGPGPRRTRPGLTHADRYWVYGRGGEPCRDCGARLEAAPLGRDRRGTVWCPGCQGYDG